jgi:hypothetical protein
MYTATSRYVFCDLEIYVLCDLETYVHLVPKIYVQYTVTCRRHNVHFNLDIYVLCDLKSYVLYDLVICVLYDLISARQGSPRGQFFLVASCARHGLHWKSSVGTGLHW